MARRIKEGSFYEVTAYFYDSAGDVALPTDIRYQIFCKTNEKVVRDWTTVPIGTSVTITATADDNAIINDINAREIRQLVVQTNYTDPSLQTTESIEWEVQNLRGFT